MIIDNTETRRKSQLEQKLSNGRVNEQRDGKTLAFFLLFTSFLHWVYSSIVLHGTQNPPLQSSHNNSQYYAKLCFFFRFLFLCELENWTIRICDLAAINSWCKTGAKERPGARKNSPSSRAIAQATQHYSNWINERGISHPIEVVVVVARGVRRVFCFEEYNMQEGKLFGGTFTHNNLIFFSRNRVKCPAQISRVTCDERCTLDGFEIVTTF